MPAITIDQMKSYLSKSISSFNRNKFNGIMAEIDFRNYITQLRWGERVSIGGWIVRSEGEGNFAHNTIALFPETIEYDYEYPADRQMPNPSHGLHTICSTFHQIGIKSYFCSFNLEEVDNIISPAWSWIQLGLPTQQRYRPLFDGIEGVNFRERVYNFLRHETDVSLIPPESISEQYTKENIRIAFQSKYFAEISDVDGILWGNQFTYPLEIKEKTVANDRHVGKYFGIDIGPFVKLAFYAAKKGNLHSLFIVREIDNIDDRRLVNWWFITYDKLAQYASWVSVGGGRNMQGGASSVVKIPFSEFTLLNRENLERL